MQDLSQALQGITTLPPNPTTESLKQESVFYQSQIKQLETKLSKSQDEQQANEQQHAANIEGKIFIFSWDIITFS